MSVTVEASGSQALVVGNPASLLATITTNKILSAVIDFTSAVGATDSFVVTCKTKVRATGVEREFVIATFTGVQSQPINFSVPMDSAYSASFYIQQIAGTNRTIPWRIESIGSVSVLAEGTQLTSLGVEQTLATISGVKNVSLVADLFNLASGDTVELRMKMAHTSLGSERECIIGTYTGAQTVPIVQSIPMSSPYECTFTAKLTAGVAGNIDWRVDGL